MLARKTINIAAYFSSYIMTEILFSLVQVFDFVVCALSTVSKATKLYDQNALVSCYERNVDNDMTLVRFEMVKMLLLDRLETRL